jgi:Sporulation and spore germination
VIRRRALAFAVTLVVVIGLTGCGVGAESEPRRIDRADVPFGLADRADTSTTVPADAPYRFTIFLVDGDELQPVERGARSAPSAVQRLKRLIRGPTPAEADAGLTTLVDPDLVVEDVRIANGIATVSLSSDAAQPAGNQRALAIAQLVATTTAIPGVERVRFEVGGEPTEVPRGDGTLTTRPVSRADYEP